MNQRYKRKEVNDKFYTKKETVKLLLSELDFAKYDIIIEPSAGAGAFSLEIPNCIAIDICPEHSSIKKQNFLSFEFIDDIFLKKILTIGNPPFGKQSNLAVKFFKKAATFSDCIAFILPKSFKKSSIQNKLPINFHLIKQIDIPEKSFILNENEYDVPCIFQIWEKRIYNRNIDIKRVSSYFQFVKKSDNPDLAIRRVGFNAGTAFTECSNKSKESHYFITTNNNNITEKNINLLKWEHNNTVGPRSISKPELIEQIEQMVEQNIFS